MCKCWKENHVGKGELGSPQGDLHCSRTLASFWKRLPAEDRGLLPRAAALGPRVPEGPQACSPFAWGAPEKSASSGVSWC